MLHAALCCPYGFLQLQLLSTLVVAWAMPCLLENLRYPWLLANISVLYRCSRLTSSTWSLMGKLWSVKQTLHVPLGDRGACALRDFRIKGWFGWIEESHISRCLGQQRHLCLGSVYLGCSERYGCVAAVFAEWMKVFVVKCNQVENCSAYKHIWHSMTGH